MFNYIQKAQKGINLDWHPNAGLTMDVAEVAKEYGPDLVATLLSSNPSFIVGRIIKNRKKDSPSQIAQNNLSKKFPIDWEKANWLHKYFTKNLGYNTSLSILSSILPESGADPYKKQFKGPGRGLLQWELGDRYNHMMSYKMKGDVKDGVDPELQRQAEYIVSTVKNPQKSGEGVWHHGGHNSGFAEAEDVRQFVVNEETPALEKARAFSLGYVRPKKGIKAADLRASYVASLDSVYNSKYK